jgi:hypothetical protein
MMEPIDIILTKAEQCVAAYVGMMRRLRSIEEGLDANKHCEISDWATDADGAHAEYAVAKHLNVHWSPVVSSKLSKGEPTFKLPDVGELQVRSSKLDDGHLIIRPNDKDDHRWYVFVVTDTQKRLCSIRGKFLCGKAKVDGYWKPAKNGWWVPQSDLLPLNAVSHLRLAA